MLICRNAEGVHGKKKVGNPWSKSFFCSPLSVRLSEFYRTAHQNRRQKVVNGGLYVCARGLDIQI